MMEALKQSHLQIRPMKAEDLTRVHALDQACFTTPWTLNNFRYEVEKNPVSHQWVAEIKAGEGSPAVLIGVIVVWLLVDEIHIATLSVEPAYRRQRVATRLLCTALRAGAAMGAAAATLEVRESNLGAQRLYQQLGFQEEGRRKKYYQDNREDALILTLHNLKNDHLEAIGC